MNQEEQEVLDHEENKVVDQVDNKDYDPAAYKPNKVFANKAKGGFGRTFFVVIGVIATIIILMIIGAIVALMLIKPFGFDVAKLPAAILQLNSDQPSTYDHPLLSTEQEKVLESMGIDTKSLPTQITATQEKCAVGALGVDRVNEIKSGASPSLDDFLKAKTCF